MLPAGLLPAGLAPPAVGVFTLRTGGVSRPPYDGLNLGGHVGDDPLAVQRNRDAVLETLDLDALQFVDQVHGTDVAVVDGSATERLTADALVTATPRLGLVVMAADCLPVLLADPGAGVVAAAHAGRAGLAAGVLQRTLEQMAALGARAVSAVIGPAACGGCYELPAELADAVGAAVPGSRGTTRTGTASVDLSGGATAVLQAAGVDVRAVGGCTIEQPERYFSYRRDGRTGRHAGIVWLA